MSRPRRATLATRGVALGVVLLVLVPLLASPVLANGGTVRISRAQVGVYVVSVFTSPTPLRRGEVDVSVLVQDSAERVLAEVPVLVEARAVGFDATPIRHGATRQQATNKLFQAAKFPVEPAGDWEFVVHVGEAEGGAVSFEATLTDPTLLDRPYLLVVLLLLPVLVVGLALRARNQAR